MTILARWMAAFVLVVVTYNPTQYNYVNWSLGAWDTQMPYVVLAGLVLMAAYIVFINATLQSVGVFGVGLIGAVFAAAVWVLTDLGLIQIGSSSAVTWLSLVGLSLILGIGLSWSIIRRQLSGQVDVDEIDD